MKKEMINTLKNIVRQADEEEKEKAIAKGIIGADIFGASTVDIHMNVLAKIIESDIYTAITREELKELNYEYSRDEDLHTAHIVIRKLWEALETNPFWEKR